MIDWGHQESQPYDQFIAVSLLLRHGHPMPSIPDTPSHFSDQVTHCDHPADAQATATPSTIRRAASLARVACDNAEEILRQLDSNRARAEADGFVIVEEFVEDGSRSLSRPPTIVSEFLARVHGGDLMVSRVYMRDRTRLGRCMDPRVSMTLGEEIVGAGVEVHFEAEEPITAISVAQGKVFHQMLAFERMLDAVNVSAEHGRRTRLGIARARERRNATGDHQR